MRQVIAIHHISLDGVIQGPGGRDEDTRHGFDRGGWIGDFSDPVLSKVIVKTITAGKYDLLLGRRTYDIWAPYWPHHSDHPIGRAFNRATKYVATRRRRQLAWENSRRIDGDVVKAVRKLKTATGPEIHVWGSGDLLQTLMSAQLIDEHRLWIYPVILGQGLRLFEEGLPAQHLALVKSRRTPAGILLNTYRPVGSKRTARE